MDQQQYTNLVEVFAPLPEPRQARGKRHAWGLILTLIGAALASGERGMRAIDKWAAERRENCASSCARPGGACPTTRRCARHCERWTWKTWRPARRN